MNTPHDRAGAARIHSPWTNPADVQAAFGGDL
jgi:hypothetical protein